MLSPFSNIFVVVRDVAMSYQSSSQHSKNPREIEVHQTKQMDQT